MTPELKELLRVLCVHPDIEEATVWLKDGGEIEIKYRNYAADERACYQLIET